MQWFICGIKCAVVEWYECSCACCMECFHSIIWVLMHRSHKPSGSVCTCTDESYINVRKKLSNIIEMCSMSGVPTKVDALFFFLNHERAPESSVCIKKGTICPVP